MSIFHGENRLFSPPKVQEAYNIINFQFLMENSILKKFGLVDVKITTSFLKYSPLHCVEMYRQNVIYIRIIFIFLQTSSEGTYNTTLNNHLTTLDYYKYDLSNHLVR